MRIQATSNFRSPLFKQLCRSASGALAGPLGRQIRRLGKKPRRIHPLEASGSSGEAAPGPRDSTQASNP
eukprot:14862304-Alexandrium_andersonii.AAC.1